jgi:superfamily II DNA/RNA helicase
MRDFKSKKLRVLIGTDILSRGIDVDGISLVINYDAPPDPEDYIHRIGRTARASKAGVAITFINQKDQGKFARIEALMGYEVTKMPLAIELGPGPEYNPEANKKEFASTLYAALRSADELKIKKVFVTTPDQSGIGAGIIDRLIKASSSS